MMKKQFLLLFVALLMATLSSTVKGQLYSNQPFDTPPTLSATQAPGVWYIDRYQPATFDKYTFGGENVLRLGISAANAAANRGGQNGTFYNTQGRKFDLASDVTVLYGDLYIPADWATKHRRSDLWATTDVVDYPIIGFANTEGNNPTFRYWDGATGWVNLSQPIAYNSWTKFKMVLSGGQVTYYINGVSVASAPSTGSTYFGNVIVQGYNFGDPTLSAAQQDFTADATYDVYWDNIGTNPSTIIATTIGIPASVTCGTFDVPVTVKNFKDVGSISLVLNYDRSKLTYQSFTHPEITSATIAEIAPGELKLGYYGAAKTLADDAVLFTLHFALAPTSKGSTDFTWKNLPNTGFCEYAGPDGDPVYASTFINQTLTIPARPVVNGRTGDQYCTIQAAIDAAIEDDPINVAAGTYAENLTVGKSLSIYGPNSTTSGCSGSRVAEAILVPAANSPADWSSQLILLTGNSIRIAGLTLDGDNPSLGGTGDYNVSQGIVGSTGQGNIVIENNIIKNLATVGVYLANDAPGANMTSGNTVKNNKIDNINPTAGFGIGVYTGNNTYVDITNNCMTNVRKGIQGGENNHKANTGNVNSIWSGNSIQSYKIGIWNNLAYSAATPVTITGNTVTTVPGSTINSGIEISSIGGTSSVSVTNNSVTGAMAGINLWNNTTSALVTVGANTFTDCDYGVFANNFDGYNSNADPSAYVVDGAQIVNPKIAGVYVKDNSSNTNAATVAVQVEGNTSITGTLGSAFVVEGADATLSFNGATPASVSGTPKYITLKTNTINVPAGNIDATAVSFDGKIGSAMTLPELFAAEDKIDHKIDYSSLGFVTVKANNDYVTVNSFVAPNTTPLIKRAIDAASSLWTVNVADGTYIENVVVNKQNLTILGQSRNGTVLKGLYSGGDNNTLRFPNNNADGAVVKNMTISRDYQDWYGSTNNWGILLSGGVNNVTLENLLVKDNRNGVYVENNGQLNMSNCIVENNRTGLQITNTVRGNLHNNIIRNNQTHGVFYNLSDIPVSLSGFTFNDNSLYGNWYSQVTFRGTGTLAAQANFECNWYGTNAPTTNATDPGEKGYAALIPQQLGGTSAQATYAGEMRGNGAPFIDYVSWRTGEAANVSDPFIPVGSCGGTPIVIASATPDDIICGEADGSILVTFSGGTAPYSIVWTGGSAPSVASPYTITGIPAGLCTFTITDANGSIATSNATILYLPVSNTTSTTYYPTIQDAITAASNGDVITVCAGTYAEDIIVSKSVTILGPNANIEPCAGTRVLEAIVVPKTKAIASGEIFHVAASNVTIKGFTIDGDNPLLNSGFSSTNGADIDAAEGITVYETGINNLTVTNNILKNLSYFGVTLYDYPAGVPSSGHVISNNKFQDFGTYDAASGGANWGGGILLYNNQYAAITNNCMTNVRLGIQTGNFSQANPGAPASQVISGNNIQARKRGIFHNLSYGTASAYTISNNTITGLANANETSSWDGIFLCSMSVASTATGNIINGSGVSAIPTTGIPVWNCQTAPLISGGTISGVGLGINVNNFESYPATGSNAGNTFATIDGVFISGATIAGVKVHDNPLNTNGATVFAEIKNLMVTTSPTGIWVTGADASANIHNNMIKATAVGINVTGTVTSSTSGLTISNNQIAISSQLAGSTPTVGISLSKVTGTAAAAISSNTISNSYYGYLVYNLNTLPKSIISGGTITGVMQGVSALNIDPATLAAYAPSTLGVSDIAMSGFAGNYPSLPNSNFHAGVYVFTGGADAAAGITATVDKVSVTGTGKIQGDCAGLYFTDWSSNAVNMQNITVTECTLTNNLNRGIFVSGKNALVNIGTSTLTGNGSDPYGLNGNEGFGIIVRKGAVANVHNCFITNPAAVSGGYQVSALCTDPANAGSATINATENSLSQGGNSTSWLANNTAGATINASCNWWGTPVTSDIALKINGTVTYPTLLISGLDASGDAGFQPNGSCVTKEVVINCVADVTLPSCSTQADVNTAYATFIGSATASGCDGVLSNNAPATAPSICGGSVTVTWTYTSLCETKTCNATFTVTAAPVVSLTCPVNVTEESCQDQTAIDAKFATWLGTVVASGGCNGVLTNNNDGAPLATGGSKTVIFSYTSSCGTSPTTCSATFTVASPKKISGYLKYNNLAQTSLNKATVTLSGNSSATTTTGSDGYYEFTGLCNGNYTITITDDRAVGYINLTDAAQVNKWGTSGGTIQYAQFLAGDVTNNLYINSTDAQRIQQYFVNGVAFDRAPWSYWKKGVTINNTDMPKPANFDVTVNGADVPNFDIYGMCTGDFNGSFTPATKSAKWTLELNNSSMVNAGANQEFELSMRAASAMQVGAISMILNIPSGLVNVKDVLVNGSSVSAAWAVKGDELRIGWYASTPVNVTENGKLITLKLMTTNAFTVGQTMDIALKFDPLNELADGNFDVIQDATLLVAQVGNGVTGIINPGDAQGLLLSNYPNPFKGSTTVDYQLPVNGKVTISVYNQIGQLVKTLVDGNQNAGDYSIRMDANNLMPGIYIAKLRLTNTNVDLTGTLKLSVLK
jgi:hypothetical protein